MSFRVHPKYRFYACKDVFTTTLTEKHASSEPQVLVDRMMPCPYCGELNVVRMRSDQVPGVSVLKGAGDPADKTPALAQLAADPTCVAELILDGAPGEAEA